eukprot:1228935-Amphidinium_carterae.1
MQWATTTASWHRALFKGLQRSPTAFLQKSLRCWEPNAAKYPDFFSLTSGHDQHLAHVDGQVLGPRRCPGATTHMALRKRLSPIEQRNMTNKGEGLPIKSDSLLSTEAMIKLSMELIVLASIRPSSRSR